MSFSMKKIYRKLHLWLGLLSGIVVFTVCITGCLYAFKDEINNLRQPYKFIEAQEVPMMQPHKLIAIAEERTGIPAASIGAITYGEKTDAVKLDYFSKDGSSEVYVNPYSGEIIKVVTKKPGEFDFFRFVLTGHRTLWLPRSVGKPIIGFGVLFFVVTLITGVAIWLPKKWNKKTAKNSLTIKLKGPWHRLNWKLHTVLGAYAFIVLLACSLTGLVWSFGWFSKSLYYVTSGGEELKPYRMPQSDTTRVDLALSFPLDSLYQHLTKAEPAATSYYYAMPRNEKGVIRVSVVHKRGSYYRTDNLFFDQYTLQPLQGQGPYAGRYTEASAADKLRRMNLEIHDGRILGLPGRIIVFIGSLVGASLPVTGFIIWFRKQRNKKRKRAANA